MPAAFWIWNAVEELEEFLNNPEPRTVSCPVVSVAGGTPVPIEAEPLSEYAVVALVVRNTSVPVVPAVPVVRYILYPAGVPPVGVDQERLQVRFVLAVVHVDDSLEIKVSPPY